ncbi:hypothetical protein DPMN_087652 [Dreissena polymorpha]|uniref:Uncharacterized protein n=1 Tax=Dreissena polymorpha TaxID=45954 RepID=A0A9D4J4U5_DREPO|nr:hypothetical protein DPMN_153452 [Dreissena polymorpha]KAH3845372.1 hypothetical protein DPMN_087652 [Dreissena polymorpha]
MVPTLVGPPGQSFQRSYVNLDNGPYVILTSRTLVPTLFCQPRQWFLRYFDNQDNGFYVILTPKTMVPPIGCKLNNIVKPQSHKNAGSTRFISGMIRHVNRVAAV